MWTVIKQMLTSKKFLATLLSIVVWVGARLGWNVDYDTLLGVVSPLWLFILGQGLADTGKEKAVVEAKAAMDLDGARFDRVANRGNWQAGRINCEMAAGIVAVGIGVVALVAMLLGGCGPLKKAGEADARHAIDCGKAQIVPTSAKLVSGIEAIVMGVDGAPDRTALLDTLVAGAEDATACALKAAAIDLAERLTPGPDAPKVEGQESLGLERIRAYVKARGFAYASSAAVP